MITIHQGDDGQLAGYSGQARDMTEWREAEEALRASQTELRRFAAQHLTIQETERRRIAADLHDGLGQSLSLLKLGIQEALRQMSAGVPLKAVESVKHLLPKVTGALDELRRVAMDLRPSTLDDLGLLPTLSWFVGEFEIANPNTRMEKHISVVEKDVPEPLKLAIFRILQEAVNNAVKHSDADCITVSLHNADDVLAFTVEDDGKGFDRDALTSRGDAIRGLGMQSMRERADVSGGTCAVTSAVGQGTKVCVVWPVEQALIAANAASGKCEIANRPFPIQNECKNAGKARKNIATAEGDALALKPVWKEAYRALPDTLTLGEMETEYGLYTPP